MKIWYNNQFQQMRANLLFQVRRVDNTGVGKSFKRGRTGGVGGNTPKLYKTVLYPRTFLDLVDRMLKTKVGSVEASVINFELISRKKRGVGCS